MKKLLTKKQKEAECRKQIKECVKAIEAKLIDKMKAALNSGGVPEYFRESGNYFLTKAIIDSFCIDRPYSMLDNEVKKDAKNIHLMC